MQTAMRPFATSKQVRHFRESEKKGKNLLTVYGVGGAKVVKYIEIGLGCIGEKMGLGDVGL